MFQLKKTKSKEKTVRDPSVKSRRIMKRIGNDEETMPYFTLTPEGYVVVRSNDKEQPYYFAEYLQVGSTDLNALNLAEIQQYTDRFTDFNRIMVNNYKIIALSFPVTTQVQQDMWRERLNRATSYDRRRACIEKIQRLQWVEQNLRNREYYIVVYAKSRKQLDDEVRQVKRWGGQTLPLSQVSLVKKKRLFFKFMNLNIHDF